MSAPTLVSYNSAGINGTAGGSATVHTTSSFSITAGNILVAVNGVEDFSATQQPGIATDSGSNTWTNRVLVAPGAGNGQARIDTATAAASTSITGSLNKTYTSGTNFFWGGGLFVFSGSGGVGASNSTNSTGAPSLSLTTTQDNSAIVVMVVDWNTVDGTSRTWRTVNGITPTVGNGGENAYFTNGTNDTFYIAYYSDAGTAGAKTVGLSAPTGQKYVIAALEIKGTAGATRMTSRQDGIGYGGMQVMSGGVRC